MPVTVIREGKHVGPLIVAGGLLALALADGGYGIGEAAFAGLLAWWTLAARELAGPGERVPAAARVALAALLGFVVITGLSLAWADDDGQAFADLLRALSYLGLFALVVSAAARGSAPSWLEGVIWGCVAVAVLALAARLLPVLDPSPESELALTQGRLNFPIGYWNGLAAVCAIALVGACWLGSAARSSGQRLAGAALIPPLALAMYLTTSRGGAMAAAAGVLVLAIVAQDRVGLLATLLSGVPAAALLCLAAEAAADVREGTTSIEAGHLLILGAVVAAALAAGLLRRRLETAGALHTLVERGGKLAVPLAAGAVFVGVALVVAGVAGGSEQDDPGSPFPSGSASGRREFWSAALDAFSSRPLGGLGAGGYEAWWTRTGDLAFNTRNAHSLPLETLAELGVAGLSALVAFFAVCLVAGWRRRPATPAVSGLLAVAVCGLVSATIEWTWELPAVFAPVVICLALLAGRATEGAGEPPPAAPQGAPRRGAARTAAISLACAAGVVACGLAAATEWELAGSREAVREGDLDVAASRAGLAADLQPWAAEPRLQAGLVAELRGNLAEAGRRLEEAAERAPEDWRIWVARTRVDLKRGDVDAAFADVTRARELNPRNPVIFEGR